MNRRFIFPIIFIIYIAFEFFDDLFFLSGSGLTGSLLWFGILALIPIMSYFSSQEEKKRKAREQTTFERTKLPKEEAEASLNKKPLSDEFAIDPDDYKL